MCIYVDSFAQSVARIAGIFFVTASTRGASLRGWRTRGVTSSPSERIEADRDDRSGKTSVARVPRACSSFY